MNQDLPIFDYKRFMETVFPRLTAPQTLDDARAALQVAIDSAFVLLRPAMGKDAPSEMLQDAHHLAQIIVLRSVSIMRLAEGVQYVNATNPVHSLKPTLDAASIWGLVRSQYEAFAAFNNIFAQHTGPEQELLFNLWVISGLKYRQRFRGPLEDLDIANDLPPELLQKANEERDAIIQRQAHIEAMPLFTALVSDKQEEVREAIRKKEFKYVFKNGVPTYQPWHELFNRTVDTKLFDSHYTYMSLWSHPSNVSAFSFKDLFSSGAVAGQVEMAVHFASLLLAFMLRDKMSVFPECRAAFEELPPPHQVLLDGWNEWFRGKDMRIVRIPMP